MVVVEPFCPLEGKRVPGVDVEPNKSTPTGRRGWITPPPSQRLVSLSKGEMSGRSAPWNLPGVEEGARAVATCHWETRLIHAEVRG